LPIQLQTPEVAAEIYAIGTPREEKFSTTMTRGIVSAYRTVRDGAFTQDETAQDLKIIQGDAVIHGGNSGGAVVDRFGNVVAVAVAGIVLGDRKVGTSINYYIPVADALKHLNIELVEPDTA